MDLRRHAAEDSDRDRGPSQGPRAPGEHAESTSASEDDVPLTTLDGTLRPGAGRLYRRVVSGDGEPHLLREDLGVVADPDRVAGRTSMLYFAHHTDVHICDVQSPSRMEVGEKLSFLEPGTDAGHRPQEFGTVHVFDQMVRATNRVATSPVTSAPMDFLILTGDNTDNRQYCELRWFIDTLDGRTVTPNTGGPTYEGVQASSAFPWVYHPDDPSDDVYGRFGFPAVPGLLESAIRPFEAAGSAVPWLTVMGNHDVIWQGTFGNRGLLRFGDVGERMSVGADKPTRLWSFIAATAAGHLGDGIAARSLERLVAFRSTTVTADPVMRRQLPLSEYVAEYFRTGTEPGPVGHGFTEANLVDGTAYWSRPHGDRFLLVGLDTNNHLTGSEGRLGPHQTRWLRERLEQARVSQRMVIVFSHHNSLTMTNTVDDPDDPGRATPSEELVSLFDEHNVVLWINGHDHENRVLAHGGFWEVTTASCIDFGQQSRTVEFVDNRDGTVSILVTIVDHLAPLDVAVRRDGHYSPAEIASFSREFASNDSRWIDPWDHRGGPQDRNVELVVRDPEQRV